MEDSRRRSLSLSTPSSQVRVSNRFSPRRKSLELSRDAILDYLNFLDQTSPTTPRSEQTELENLKCRKREQYTLRLSDIGRRLKQLNQEEKEFKRQRFLNSGYHGSTRPSKKEK